MAFSGCVIVINQPSPEEKTLLDVQQNVEKQVKEVSQKVQSGNYSQQEITNLIGQAENTIQDGLNKLNQLNLPEKAKAAGEKTKIYLESAQKIFGQLKGLLTEFDKIKQQGQELSDQAKKVIQQQIAKIQTNIKTFQSELDQIANNINQTGQQITDLYKQATK
jgi:chromosome segregation ATPase